MNRKNNVTMQTIAEKLKITKVSVSKALNNQPGVSENLKRQIIDVANELGYISKRGEMSRVVIKKLGFLVPKRFFLEIDKFYSVIYYYLSRECGQNDIDLVLYIINSEDEKNLTLPYSFKKDNLNGLFIAGEMSDAYIQMLIRENIPIVAIDFYQSHLQLDCIVPDNYYSSYIATSYLISRGHKDIGFVGNPSYAASVMDRFYGYMKALAHNKLEYHKEWHIINNDQSGIYTTDFVLPNPLPSAYICFCDMGAYYLIQKLQSKGISVPDEVSLVSFDNTDLSQSCNPPLTTIDINKREFAHKALQRMLWRTGNCGEIAHRDIVNTKLIERLSVATRKAI